MLVTWVRLQRDAYQFTALVSHIDLLPCCQGRNSSMSFMSWVSERMEQLPLTFLKKEKSDGFSIFYETK